MLKKRQSPQGDLFVIDALDVVLKGDIDSLEHPFYALSKKPDREVRTYHYGDKWIQFQPSVKGAPTIYDKDLIIYAISHLINNGDEYGPSECFDGELEIDPYSFLTFTHRGTGGRAYDALADALDRLAGTRIRTNIIEGEDMVDQWFGIVDEAYMKTNKVTGRPETIRMRLSRQVLESIRSRRVLTLHRDYFRLTRPIERRLYELARKHCGKQESWSISLDKLHVKSGSKGSIREFRRSVKQIAATNHLPDYDLVYLQEENKVLFSPRLEFFCAMSGLAKPKKVK